jgi:hypothetical protein
MSGRRIARVAGQDGWAPHGWAVLAGASHLSRAHRQSGSDTHFPPLHAKLDARNNLHIRPAQQLLLRLSESMEVVSGGTVSGV